MVSTEVVSKLTEEELIELAKKAPPVQVQPERELRPEDYTKAKDFLDALEIRAGERVVDSSAVYEAYKLWADLPKEKKDFNSEMKLYVKMKLNKGVYVFKLNKNINAIREKLEAANEEENKEKQT